MLDELGISKRSDIPRSVCDAVRICKPHVQSLGTLRSPSGKAMSDARHIEALYAPPFDEVTLASTWG